MSAIRNSTPQESAIQLNPDVAALLSRLDPGHPAVKLAFQNETTDQARGICINEWLRHKGYLVLKNEPAALSDVDTAPAQ